METAEHEVTIRARLEGEEEVSSGFRRMGEASKHMGAEIRSMGREIAVLGASGVAVARLGENFGVLSKEQAGAIREMGSMIALSGTVVRGLSYIAGASWTVTLAEKARAAAHGFADAMAAGISKVYGAIVSALDAIASSSIATAIAEKARAAAHALAHAFEGPAGWAILAGAAAMAATYVALAEGYIKLAEGGIVYKPTFALIGEKEPEAVIPLSKITQTWAPKTNYINVTINAAATPAATGDAVIDSLRRAGVI